MYQSFDDYMRQYVSAVPFAFTELIEKEIGDINVRIMVMEYNDGYQYRAKAHIELTKGSLKYECFCIDHHSWADLFFLLHLEGKSYLCFRKTLYGFTLIDTETLVEEYDYFPKQVLEGQESFIFINAQAFRNFIVFDGCYWACPYSYYVYDSKNKKFLSIFERFDLFSGDNGVTVTEDKLILDCTDEDDRCITLTLSFEKLCELMETHGRDSF